MLFKDSSRARLSLEIPQKRPDTTQGEQRPQQTREATSWLRTRRTDLILKGVEREGRERETERERERERTSRN